MDIPLPAEGGPLYVTPEGRIDAGHRWDPLRPTAILAGAFNPVHAGHLGLADIAAEFLGLPVAFELSVANVDKPGLDPAELRCRAAQFAGRAPLWLTHAPRFVEKADLFPGAVFVVGADTALRIVEPRYNGDPARLHDALGRLRERGCRFLVACRIDSAGHCVEPTDVPVPLRWRDLFAGIPSERFRLDLSSTQLRASPRFRTM
jgi:hypothetical protein